MCVSIAIIGGDLRQLTLAALLCDEGFNVSVFGFGDNAVPNKYKAANSINEIKASDILILPMPITLDSKNVNAPFSNCQIPLYSVVSHFKSTPLILGGRIGKDVYDIFHGKKCIDYYNREELMIKNAVPTAEGAVEIAMSETSTTLKNSRCLIIGYGRIGKVLSRLLYNIGADVTVSARKCSDLAWIDVNGYNPIHNDEIGYLADSFDIIFNTAPALILTENVLKKVNPDSIVIDLASKPGGVDFDVARNLGLKVIWALSLPGKSAPLTSGKIIKDTVMNIIREEGV